MRRAPRWSHRNYPSRNNCRKPTKVPFDPCNCRNNQLLHCEFQALRCAWLDWCHLAHLRCCDASGEGGDLSNSYVNYVMVMEIEKTNKWQMMRIWIDGTNKKSCWPSLGYEVIQFQGLSSFIQLHSALNFSTCSRSSRNGLKIAWRSWPHCMRHNSWRLSELSW